MRVVTLSSAALSVISTEATASADGLETGGILLGHDDGSTMHVTVAGDPGPDAVREKRRFLRDLAHAQTLADDAYERDASVWIGEWHTHPDGPPEPSDVDLTTYAKHLADGRLGFDRFLSVIVLPCPEHGWEHVSAVAWVVAGNIVELADIRAEDADV
jgi:integrative and conjugative element protein (TIGR02256 family)